MGPTWGPSGADRTQVGPMLASWTLLSGWLICWYPWYYVVSTNLSVLHLAFLSDAQLSSSAELIVTTHLKNNVDNQPYLPGFKWYGHCRETQHILANKRHGGVGIFVNDMCFKYYTVSVIDQSFDGILGMLFQHKFTGFQFIVFSCYLPPEESPWGRDSTAYFGHLLSQVYFHNYVDCVFICTDTNGRTGGLGDYVSAVDHDIPTRVLIDNEKNKHGESFVDFMLESKMCIVNGRVTAENDGFTSKGRSVVDYICVPHECVTNCVHFGVHNTKDLITKLNLQGLIGEGCKPPDHTVLELNYITDFTDEHVTESSLKQNITKRYDFNNIANDFMATPLGHRYAIHSCVE